MAKSMPIGRPLDADWLPTTPIFRSGSSMQASVLSVLAAVTELIHETSGGDTDTEYFGALVSTLELPSDLTKLSYGRCTVARAV